MPTWQGTHADDGKEHGATWQGRQARVARNTCRRGEEHLMTWQRAHVLLMDESTGTSSENIVCSSEQVKWVERPAFE